MKAKLRTPVHSTEVLQARISSTSASVVPTRASVLSSHIKLVHRMEDIVESVNRLVLLSKALRDPITTGLVDIIQSLVPPNPSVEESLWRARWS